MKLSHACGATQDGRVMVERSDRMWSTGEGNGKPLQYSCFENPMNSMKRQNDRILKDEVPGLVGAQYATGDQWTNNSRKNEGMEPKQKEYPAVDVTGDRSKVRCREPARDIPLVTKVMRKGARHTQRRDRASGVPPDILEHLLPKKPESAYFIALCSHL